MDKDKDIIGLLLAGITVNCRITYPESAKFFRHYSVKPEKGMIPAGLDREDLYQIKKQYPADQPPAVSEIKMLSVILSDALLPYGRVIVHAVAFVYRNRAWLLTAPSGTGKTTLYRNLKQGWPKEITALCGDNPILQFMEDGTVLVHHSPWNGKEGYGSKMTSPLAGIILLEQSDRNNITLLSAPDAVLPMFFQINTFLKNEEHVHLVCRMEEAVLMGFPIWRFSNLGDMDAARMAYRLIEDYSS